MRVCSNRSCQRLATYGVAVKIIIPDLPKPCVIFPAIVVCGVHKKKIKPKNVIDGLGLQNLKELFSVILEREKIYEMPRLGNIQLDFISMYCMN